MPEICPVEQLVPSFFDVPNAGRNASSHPVPRTKRALRDTASSAVSQFKYFVFNYMHTGQVASSHYAHRTKSDNLFMNTPYHFNREVFESSGGRLKVVGIAGVGIDNVDLAAAIEFGCLVVNAPTTNTVASAEHGIAHVR